MNWHTHFRCCSGAHAAAADDDDAGTALAHRADRLGNTDPRLAHRSAVMPRPSARPGHTAQESR